MGRETPLKRILTYCPRQWYLFLTFFCYLHTLHTIIIFLWAFMKNITTMKYATKKNLFYLLKKTHSESNCPILHLKPLVSMVPTQKHSYLELDPQQDLSKKCFLKCLTACTSFFKHYLNLHWYEIINNHWLAKWGEKERMVARRGRKYALI